jgi:phosphinothricin acetyltransferase
MSVIRVATPDDAVSILEIYAPYIVNTSYTFETDVPDIGQFKDRISDYLVSYPWLICEIDDTVAGYAYASKHRERLAYQWSAECSVYVHDHFQRRGVARALYLSLIEILELQQFRNLYAVINLPNDRSVAFHEDMGFEYFATYKNVGYKLGKWKNVGWWQLQLNEYSPEPLPPTKFFDMDQERVANILRKARDFLRPQGNSRHGPQ